MRRQPKRAGAPRRSDIAETRAKDKAGHRLAALLSRSTMRKHEREPSGLPVVVLVSECDAV